MINQHIMTRKQAFKLAWSIFWMATGTRRMAIRFNSDSIDLLGNDIIGKES